MNVFQQKPNINKITSNYIKYQRKQFADGQRQQLNYSTNHQSSSFQQQICNPCPSSSSLQNQNINQNHKYYFRIIAMGCASFLCLLLFNLYHFTSYISVSKKIKANNEADSNQLQNHLYWLTRPTMPFFRQQFYEEYIYELGKNKKWNQLVVRADQAIGLSGNKQKFSIHYHKSMALCFLQRFKQCKKAIKQAYKYSSQQKLHFIKNIYDILLSNGQVTKNEIPSGTEFTIESLKKQKTLLTNTKKEEQNNLEQI